MMQARAILLPILMLASGDALSPAAAQDPPASQQQLTPEMEKQLERQRIELESAGLPTVKIDQIEKIVRFALEDDRLAVSTTLTPVQGEVRVVHPKLPGVVRMRVMDLQAIGDVSSGRNFSFVQQDLTQPGTLQVYTHVNAIAGRLNLARDAEADEVQWQVELIQDPPGTPPEPDAHPVRLMVRIYNNSEDKPDTNLTLGAASFTELRQRYPREVETYLRPILRDFQQDQAIFAVDERVAWQVLGGEQPPEAQASDAVTKVLEKFDSHDYREREAALGELKRLGQPAARVLAGADRSGLSPEQNAGVDEFLAEYLPLSEQDVARLSSSPDFLLDTLASENPALRKLAWAQLQRIAAVEQDFDPDAPAATRAAQLQRLRSALLASAPTTGPTEPAPRP